MVLRRGFLWHDKTVHTETRKKPDLGRVSYPSRMQKSDFRCCYSYQLGQHFKDGERRRLKSKEDQRGENLESIDFRRLKPLSSLGRYPKRISGCENRFKLTAIQVHTGGKYAIHLIPTHLHVKRSHF